VLADVAGAHTAPGRGMRARALGAPATVLLFLAGYLAVWMAAGLLAYVAIEAVRASRAGLLAWSQGGRYLAGAAVLAAGLWQLTSSKRRWLERCRAPKAPAAGIPALRAGTKHGVCCVACCWALMASLYALGMMSVAWMALLTVLIAAERVLPRPLQAARAIAFVLAALGIAVALAPAAVPALTMPSPAGGSTMRMGPMAARGAMPASRGASRHRTMSMTSAR